jgi:predicted GNAT family acetyltransferase
MEQVKVINNPEAGRFEVQLNGQTAVLDYSISNKSIYYTHTTVPSALEGRGIGSALAKAGMEFARENGYKVVPICSFIRTYMDRHPEVSDLRETGDTIC